MANPQPANIPCSCIICRKQFTVQGIVTHHMRSHGNEHEKSKFIGAIDQKHTLKQTNITIYNTQPTLCKCCGTALPYDKRHQEFCSSSCSATVVGRRRTLTAEAKLNVQNKAKQNAPLLYTYSVARQQHRLSTASPEEAERLQRTILKRREQDLFKQTICGEFSTVYQNNCKECGCKWVGQTYKKYCRDCQQKTARTTDLYKFQFNVFEYSDLFELDLIHQYGWFSAGGKKRTVNLTGVSRDHRVSVSEAVANGYDIYYITHPLNCELMLHADNNKKKGRSSISYQQLQQLVDEYDLKCGRSPADLHRSLLFHRQ